MFIYKLIDNKKGSTLLMVLVTTVVLTILGTALISMTFMNLNMKYVDMRGKVSRYYSEAGIDEAYAVVAHYIDEALAYATVYTANALENHIATESYSVIFNDDGTFKDEYLQAYSDDQFKDGFVEFFESDTGIITSNTVNMLNEINEISASIDSRATDSNNTYSISVSETDISTFYTNGNRLIIGNVVSTFSYLDITNQTISTDIVIQKPPMQYPLKITEEKVNILNNPIWQNALVATGDIFLAPQDSLTITGDVFAEGTIPVSDEDKKDPTNFGGIVVVDGSTQIVDGDLVTSSYLQVAAPNASISTSDSNIFANTVVIQSGADYGSISAINSEVYTRDDIELNAASGNITIGGSFYGFSDGRDAAITHDNSSSIIVNNVIGGRDANDNASITITGQPTTASNTYSSENEGIYIAGTAYVNRVGADPYQTAESLAIESNYMFYRHRILDDDVDISNIYRDSNVVWEEVGEANYFDGISTPYQAPTTANKINYFKEYYNTYAPTQNAMFFYNNGMSDGVSVALNEIQYSLGLTFVNGLINDEIGAFGLAQVVLDESKARYNYYTKFLGNINEFEEVCTNPNDSISIRDGVADKINDFGGLQFIPDVVSLYSDSTFDVTNYTNVDYSVAKRYDRMDEALAPEDTSQVIAVHLNDPSVDRVVIGTTGSEPNTVYYAPASGDNLVQGIIIADCDVEIRGNGTEFVGCIITEEDIRIDGTGNMSVLGYHNNVDDLTFTDEELFILRTIHNYPILESYFSFEPLLEAGTNNGVYNDTYGTVEYVHVTKLDMSDSADSNRDRYSDIIYFDNWTID